MDEILTHFTREAPLKKVIIAILVLAVAGAGAFYHFRAKAAKKNVKYTEVAVKRGDLTEKALAVGKIDPDHEVVIKSQISGTVEKINREVGEQVTRGEALMVVKPEPTPIEIAEAQRQYELAELNRKYLEVDLKRTKALYENKYISGKDYDSARKQLTARLDDARRDAEKAAFEAHWPRLESALTGPLSGLTDGESQVEQALSDRRRTLVALRKLHGEVTHARTQVTHHTRAHGLRQGELEQAAAAEARSTATIGRIIGQ
jgi:multidrug efflux pump subunit AcrA (membrane-fusion protein)